MSETNEPKVSRRTLLRIGGCAGVFLATGGVAGGIVATQTDFIDRVRGKSDTPVLDDPTAWEYADPTLTLALASIPDLAEPGHAVQLDDDTLPEPLLILHGTDDEYYVFVNKCPHAKRKIDPLGDKLECTSISQSSFDYTGKVLSGPADSPLTSYEVVHDGEQLIVTLA